MRQESPESQPQALRSFVIGFAVICVAYMVPVLGFVAWAMVGVFGLGAATLAVHRRVPAGESGPATPRAVGWPSTSAVRHQSTDGGRRCRSPRRAGRSLGRRRRPGPSRGDLTSCRFLEPHSVTGSPRSCST